MSLSPLVATVVVLFISDSSSYYQAQFDQVAPLKATRDVCVNMIPPYTDRKPYRNRYEMKVEVEAMWISHKRLSICAFSPPDRFQAFSGMMVQIMRNNEPVGTFEPEEKLEIIDCPPGKQLPKPVVIEKQTTTDLYNIQEEQANRGTADENLNEEQKAITDENLACLRASRKLLQAAVNWVSPPGFDVHNPHLECVVTIIGLNQKYWTIDFPIDAAPYRYPEYGNFTNELKYAKTLNTTQLAA